MKKIISIFILSLIILGNINFTFAKSCTKDLDCTIGVETCKINYVLDPPSWTCVSTLATVDTWCDSCTLAPAIPQICASDTIEKTCNNKTYCCAKPTTTTTDTSTSAMGITCNEDQLVNGQCKLNIYDTLGIRKSVRDKDDPTSVGLFVQDIVLSATFFIGTLVTIALVVSGLMFIFAASSGKDPANAKKWITGSLIWLLIVVSSYVIIRLVQYIAKWF